MGKDEAWKFPYWSVEDALKEARLWLKVDKNTSLQRVGQGRLTEVYFLESPNYAFPLAIKVPAYGQEVQMEEAKRRVLRDGWEMSYAAKELPEYFPRVCMYEEGGRFLIRENCCGEPLLEYLKQQSISMRQIFFYKITEMAAKVMELHFNFTQGAKVFGGFAMENIVVDPVTQGLRLLDCGSVIEEKRTLVKSAQGPSAEFRQRKGHIPLEKVFERQELCDRRIDFFGYGVLAYEVLFLELPFTTALWDKETLWQRWHEEYRQAVLRLQTAEETQGIPKDLLWQCIGSLHPDVHKRFCGRLMTEV